MAGGTYAETPVAEDSWEESSVEAELIGPTAGTGPRRQNDGSLSHSSSNAN